MIYVCFAYVLIYGALMAIASASIETNTRNRAMILSGLNLLALAYLLVMR